jgi:excisionase family DNA binding protein
VAALAEALRPLVAALVAEELAKVRPEPSQPLLSVTQAAGALGVHPNSVYRLIERGQLRAQRVGRVWRIRPEDLGDTLAPEPRRKNPSRRPRRPRRPGPGQTFTDLARSLPYAASEN